VYRSSQEEDDLEKAAKATEQIKINTEIRLASHLTIFNIRSSSLGRFEKVQNSILIDWGVRNALLLAA
jgi:hypothetical protein